MIWTFCLFVGWNQSVGEWKDRTDAVAHPGAVVVKLGDAAVAHSAVFGPDGFPYLRGGRGHKKQRDVAAPLLASSVYVGFCAAFTKQVLQNMLRSRLPVSASSTIVWNEIQKELEEN